VLGNLEREGQRLVAEGAVNLEGVEDAGHLVGRKLDVDDRTDHAYDAADAPRLGRARLGLFGGRCHSALASVLIVDSV